MYACNACILAPDSVFGRRRQCCTIQNQAPHESIISQQLNTLKPLRGYPNQSLNNPENIRISHWIIEGIYESHIVISCAVLRHDISLNPSRSFTSLSAGECGLPMPECLGILSISSETALWIIQPAKYRFAIYSCGSLRTRS